MWSIKFTSQVIIIHMHVTLCICKNLFILCTKNYWSSETFVIEYQVNFWLIKNFSSLINSIYIEGYHLCTHHGWEWRRSLYYLIIAYWFLCPWQTWGQYTTTNETRQSQYSQQESELRRFRCRWYEYEWPSLVRIMLRNLPSCSIEKWIGYLLQALWPRLRLLVQAHGSNHPQHAR